MLHHALAALVSWAVTTAAAEVDPKAYQADLLALARTPREPGTQGWQQAQHRVAQRFAELGYEVERHAYHVDTAYGPARGVNIVGVLRGSVKPEEIVLVSAHYDSNPGQTGADDNASGVAGMLAVAKSLAHTQPDRTLMVAAWDQEESGIIGSKAWAEQARKRGLNILHAYVFEMIGYRDTAPHTQRMPKGLDLLYPTAKKFLEARRYAGDSIVLVGTHERQLRAFASKGEGHGLPVLPLHVWWRLRRFCPPDLRRSDHDAFWRNGYEATMITDSANFRNPNYHRVSDTTDTIDVNFACNVVRTTIDTVGAQLAAIADG